MSDVFRLTCLTPVHVGSGEELARDIDYFSDGSTTYVLDPERLITAGIAVAGLPEAIVRGERIGDVLRAKRLDPRGLAAHTVTGRIEASKLRLALRAGDGRPVLPGSTLKGALRTLLLVGWASNGRPHGERSATAQTAIASGLRERKPNSKALDGQLFRSPRLRDPQGDVLRTLDVSDALFHPGCLDVMSSKAVGTFRTTLTAVEALKTDATASVRLTIDRSGTLSRLGLPHSVPSWSELANWSRSHARHLLEADERYFADQPADGPLRQCGQLLNQLEALPGESLVVRLAWGTGWRTMTGDLLSESERSQLRMRVGKTRKVILNGHASDATPAGVFGWIRLDPISIAEARTLFAPPIVPVPSSTDDQRAEGSTTRESAARPITDPFLARLRSFKESEYGQIPQLLMEIQSRPEREVCLREFAAQLLRLYASDKKRLKTLREKFSALAPYLAKP